MPLIRLRPSPAAARPTGPRCRGGASSLLRLSPPLDRRLPRAGLAGDPFGRDFDDLLLPVTGPLTFDRGAA